MSARTGAVSAVFDGWTSPDLSALRRTLSDPEGAAAERRAGQAGIDAMFAAHDARVRAEQERQWAEEEGEAIVAAMNRAQGHA